jgi:hypothetical protein
MMFLTTVQHSFNVQTRGCYIVPVMWKSDLKICEGEKVELRAPDGKVLNSEIVEITTGKSTSGRFLAIRLGRALTNDDVPEGTEIWLVDQGTP